MASPAERARKVTFQSGKDGTGMTHLRPMSAEERGTLEDRAKAAERTPPERRTLAQTDVLNELRERRDHEAALEESRRQSAENQRVIRDRRDALGRDPSPELTEGAHRFAARRGR